MKKSLLDQKNSIQMVTKPTNILKFLWIQILTLKNVMTIYYMTKKPKKKQYQVILKMILMSMTTLIIGLKTSI